MPLFLNRYIDGGTHSIFIFFCLRILEESLKETCAGSFSELFCWFLLSLIALCAHHWLPTSSRRGTFPSVHIWYISAGLVVSSWCLSSEISGWVWPVLSIALLSFRQNSPSLVPLSSIENDVFQAIWKWFLLVATMLFSLASLHFSASAWSNATTIVFLGAQLTIYLPLNAFAVHQTEPFALRDVASLVTRIGLHAIPGMTLLFGWKAFTIGFSTDILAKGFLLGIFKASQWLILLCIHDQPPWNIMASAGTVAASTFAIAQLADSFTRALACVAISGMALNHSVNMLPVSSYRSASLLYWLVLIPVLVLWNRSTFHPHSLGLYLKPYYHGSPPVWPHRAQHPVELLAKYQQKRFNAMVERQSTSYQAAETEYKRRYQKSPPFGFEAWFNYAQRHNSLIIDDFDSIGHSLRNFRSQNTAKIKELVESAAKIEGAHIFWCSVRGGKFDGGGCEWMGDEISELLADLEASLLDTPLALNTLDEPRVLIDFNNHNTVGWTDASRGSIWNRITEYCNLTQASKYLDDMHIRQELFSLPFIWDAVEAKDLCVHPEYSSMHGFFQSPSTFIYTRSAVPILSPAKPSTFDDILYPPPYYMSIYDEGKYKEEEDPPWDQKRAKLYWAGSTTGSHANNENWSNSHRQRFVARVNQLYNYNVTFLTQGGSGIWETFESPDIFKELYDVKFTAVIQCEALQCEEESGFFHPGSREDSNAGMQYKFIFDLDGNSFSGRFYLLLASRSVVFKQTIFKEWHDERLFPWLHYVPVSLDMGELPEIMRYLALTDSGEERAKSIADAGREWLGKALRKEDAAIYMYRLLLELGRLMQDEDL